MNQSELFTKYYDLYQEALSARKDIDLRIKRRYEVYRGSEDVLSLSRQDESPARKYSDRKVVPYRRLAFEMVEAQVDVSIPLAKISPRYAEDSVLASSLEEYLNMEAEQLDSEEVNDFAEREVKIQGTGVYQIDWDELAGTPRRRGDLKINFIRLADFYPQPYVDSPDSLEYAFVCTTTTVRKVKQLYDFDIEPDNGTKNSIDLIICWYINEDGDVSKLVWTKQTNVVVYSMPNYFARKVRVCAVCGSPWDSSVKKCAVCGSTKSKLVDEDTFTVPEDIMKADTDDPTHAKQVYVAKDTPIQLYRIKSLPFVIRKNISDAGGGLYGLSDVDLVEELQDANNKILGKMTENIMSGGTVLNLPANATFDNNGSSLKIVRMRGGNQPPATTQPIQANTQQDDILQDRFYQLARQCIGITDSYQGKRDPTAESGKAKEISANQAAGRLESKYIDKMAAYSVIYRKMFEFLLAFSDEKRTMVKPYEGSKIEEASFSKYNFIVKGEKSNYLNDDFIFATNGSYMLSNKKESLWNATTQNFMAGAFGNVQDPKVVLSYWEIMSRYGYPLAGKVIEFLTQNVDVIPPALEQALAQNPDLINQFMAMLQAKGEIAKNKQITDAKQAQEILDPMSQPLKTSTTDNDITNPQAAKTADRTEAKA